MHHLASTFFVSRASSTGKSNIKGNFRKSLDFGDPFKMDWRLNFGLRTAALIYWMSANRLSWICFIRTYALIEQKTLTTSSVAKHKMSMQYQTQNDKLQQFKYFIEISPRLGILNPSWALTLKKHYSKLFVYDYPSKHTEQRKTSTSWKKLLWTSRSNILIATPMPK